MENEQKENLTEVSDFAKASSDEQTMNENQMLLEILDNTRKTKKYMQWQFYITIALVVLPLLALVFIIPMVLKSLGSVYSGVLQ